MEVSLSVKIDEKDLEKETGKKYNEDELKEELTQMLFEVCEEWVLWGQVPDLEWKTIS